MNGLDDLEETPNTYRILVDKTPFELSHKSLSKSDYLKSIVELDTTTNDIDISAIISSVQGKNVKELAIKAFEFLREYQDRDEEVIPTPVPDTYFSKNEWHVNFINQFEMDELIVMLNIASYLCVMFLVELCCAKIASLMRFMTNDEIRELLEN